MSPIAKRRFLLGILGIAGTVAAVCIAIVLFESTLQMEGYVIGLASTVGFCLLLIFAAFTALDRPIWRLFAWVGVGLSLIAMSFVSGCILYSAVGFDTYRLYDEYHVYEWMFFSMSTAALFCLATWVGALRMKPGGRIVQWLSFGSILSTYFALLLDVSRVGGGAFLEKATITSSLAAGGSTLAVFVLYKFFGLKMPDPLTTIDQKLFLRCPRCAREQELPIGESHCVACGLRFNIDMEEPKCPACGYNLRGLARPQCPECGKMITAEGGMAAASPFEQPQI